MPICVGQIIVLTLKIGMIRRAKQAHYKIKGQILKLVKIIKLKKVTEIQLSLKQSF